MTFWDFAFASVIVVSCVAVIYILRCRVPRWQSAKIWGSGNYVDQRGTISSGDVVGGDLIKKDKPAQCPYCGGR